MSRYLSAGIDIGSHTTRVVVAEAEKQNTGPRIIGVGEAESHGVRRGYIVNHDEAVKAIREAIRRAENEAGVAVKRALVSIGGLSLDSETASGSTIISRIDGEVTAADVEQAVLASGENVNLTNKKVIHRFPLAWKLDGKEVFGRPVGLRGMKLEVKTVFVTCLVQHLEDLIRAIEAVGIEVEDVVAAPLAASLVTLSKAQRTAGCVLANIGAETVSIAVFENDQLISLDVFPIGSTDITNDIALGFRIPLDEAEEMKKGGAPSSSATSQKKLDEIIEARLRDIFDLIEAHLKKLGKNELLPAGVILTGGGAGLPTIEDLAKASLRLPARVVVPRSFKDKEETPLETMWSVAYGLCLLGFDSAYRSDLFETQSVRVRGLVHAATGWIKQFFP
ncbi:MAG: cell division protein FtsA [Parcubacteria group bacterium]|nr:cell division protein FtsA [Parcubacteria group bacterium]